MKDTMLQILCSRLRQIETQGLEILELSNMTPANRPDSDLVLISPSGNHFWKPLPDNGKQLQARLIPKADRFFQLMSAITAKLPSKAKNSLQQEAKLIQDAIEQSGTTWWKRPEEAIPDFKNSVEKICTILDSYYQSSTNEVLVIPDTNQLLKEPDIETWQFDGIRSFTLLLTPTILGELDKHKVNHKNENVRDKAEKLTKKFKEYRRRGSLQEGVTIVTNKISLRSIAAEPNMAQSLPWFDPTNADDRFLASVIETVQEAPGSTTFIVTADINMQNKAEFAGLPFDEI